MSDKLYDLMDWAEIEAVVYSEEDNPHGFMGPHIAKDGLLIQAFFPDASEVQVRLKQNGKTYPMVLEDEEGFYAVLLPQKTIPEYEYLVTYEAGTDVIQDPYAFEPQITKEETEKFNKGICYDIYEKLGAHPMTVNGMEGVYFAVWAPNAVRVSIVGDFNLWDGRRLPMRRLWNSGIYEIFLPNIKPGMIYKYELKAKGGLTYLKADPYANAAELRPNNASVIADISDFKWNDQKWIKEQEMKNHQKDPMLIYELHLGSWRKPADDPESFYNYREIAPMLADYVKEMGYTHVELMPIMEHPFDGSWGYQVTGYYAPTSRYGTPEDFAYFMDYMHEKGIGVILDWVPAHFPRDTFGLAAFDGTCLYEHLDPRKGSHPHWGTLIYNYGRPEVKNFLIANALFWVKKYHADGIRMDAVASMLYLDYGKNDGEWVANEYGGNENLEAVEFLKHLNSIFHKECPGALLIAEESTAWPKITGDLKEDGLGFDFKWNMGWMNDFIGYMSLDPYFRTYHHGELTFSMCYAYSENFILTLSHDEVVHGKGSMINKMPGELQQKFANLRAAYAFMMAHPGKKLLFMGQDFGQFDEWNEEKAIEWDMLQYDHHANMQKFTKDLLHLYQKYPALYEKDNNPDGFEWVSSDNNADLNIVTFVRKAEKPEDALFVVCNFAPVLRENLQIGVPVCGKYKEIFNSDAQVYGGTGAVNARVKVSKEEEADGSKNSIKVTVAPLGVSIYTITPVEPKKKAAAAKTTTAAKKTTAKQPAAKKATGKAKTVAPKTVKKSTIEKQTNTIAIDDTEIPVEVETTFVDAAEPVVKNTPEKKKTAAVRKSTAAKTSASKKVKPGEEMPN